MGHSSVPSTTFSVPLMTALRASHNDLRNLSSGGLAGSRLDLRDRPEPAGVPLA